jgi:hypothetical protein
VNPYQFWQESLAGLKPKMFVDDPQAGFYRRVLKVRDENGNNKRVGWSPVAVFMNGGTITGRIGNTDIIGDALNEAWSYIAGNPISEEWYRAVAERGEPWPDSAPPPEIPAANRQVDKGDNAAPEVMTDKDHAAGIDNAIGAAPKAIKSEDDAARALGSKNRIAELRLAADKAGKALYDPPYRKYKELHASWSPMVKKATDEEKRIERDILTYRESERQRIAREQEAAATKQREIDEANERAAQRAIAAGEPEAAPEVVEIEQPAAPAPIIATYGSRKLKEEVKTFLDTVNDFDQVYTYFKNAPEMKTFLTTLATAAVKAGHKLPGVTTREGLI